MKRVPLSLIRSKTLSHLKSLKLVRCEDADILFDFVSLETLEFIDCTQTMVDKIRSTLKTLKFLHVQGNVHWINFYYPGLKALQLSNVTHEFIHNHLEKCVSSELETLILEWSLSTYTPVKHQLYLEQFRCLRELVLKNIPPRAISLRSPMLISRVVLFGENLDHQGLHQKFIGSNIQEIKC